MVHKSRRYTESSYYGFVFLLLRGAEWMGVSPVHIYAQHLNFIYYLNLLTDWRDPSKVRQTDSQDRTANTIFLHAASSYRLSL